MPTEITGVKATLATTKATQIEGGLKLPPIPTQQYNFSVDSFQVLEPRSGSLGGFDKGNDSDYVGFAIQVNNSAGQHVTKFIGNNCHSGVFPVGVAFNNIALADTDAIVIITTIVNSSQGESKTFQYLNTALSKLEGAAASALVKLLTSEILTDSVKEEIGATIGATLGTAVVPVLGSALGALGGYLLGEGWGLLFPNCDGPVVASMFVYSGYELKQATANGKPLVTTTNYPGIDSPDGCGDNSNYNVTFRIVHDLTLATTTLQELGSAGVQKVGIGVQATPPRIGEPPLRAK
jgi:hypothetical protein